MEHFYLILTSSLLIADLMIRIGLSFRVVMRKLEPSITLAWLVVILVFPFAGAVIYLLFGENRLGDQRARRAAANLPYLLSWTRSLEKKGLRDWRGINPACSILDRHIRSVYGLPTMPDNHLELIDHAGSLFRALIQDINSARCSCFLQFYIWHEGGDSDLVADALIRAASRGVVCRILLDSIGSKKFLKSWQARKMREAGIEIVEALPAGILRTLFVRIDLRNHRKLVIIDSSIAYTGSQNLVDPRYFKQEEQVGQWMDTMVRLQGDLIEILTAAFIYDWTLETGMTIEEFSADLCLVHRKSSGKAPIQLVPSGPGFSEDSIHDLLLTTIYFARRELILTTPYFVPDSAILAALKSAARRGVRVILIVPEKVDSRLVHYASKARFEELSRAGVEIRLFTRGLLHSKTITVDSEFCLFGSVNLDIRSFRLNFELTLFIYDREFTCRLRALQQQYLQGTRPLDQEEHARRPVVERFLENAALLVSPLL